MQQAAKLVAEAALSRRFKTVFLDGHAYQVKSPALKVLCRAISEWSEMDFDMKEGITYAEVLGQIPSNRGSILKGLAILVVGDRRGWRHKSRRLYRRWMRGGTTAEELSLAVHEVLEFTAAEASKPFFDCAASLLSVVGAAARAK